MGHTILLADKSITIQKIVELTFADEDYVIRCISDGHSALELIPQLQPDIILADISLPGVNGYDLCSTLRTDPTYASLSKTPVILLAGIYETMDEERAKQVEDKVKNVGANDYLSKPFDSQLLTEKVKDFLARGASSTTFDDTSPDMFSTIKSEKFTESVPHPEERTESLSTEVELYPPPDDSEKTMIIQGPPSFSPSMFAEKSPFEEQSSDEAVIGSSTVKISIPDLDAARAAYARISKESAAPTNDVEDTDTFEIESTMAMKRNISDIPGSTESMSHPEEPFGNVFEESTARWRLSPLAEDENPFGLPEQEAPAPAPAPPEPVMESVSKLNANTESVRSFEVEKIESEFETVTFQRPTLIEQGPFSEPEPAVPVSSDVPEIDTVSTDFSVQKEAITENTSNLDDTWPGRKMPIAEDAGYFVETVQEEMVVNDTVGIGMQEPMEEFDNKQQDFVEVSDDAPTESIQAAPVAKEVLTPPVSYGAPLEISEELIDRIVEKVMARLSERIVSEIVWQVVPDLAEKMIRRELEKIQTSEE